RAGGGDLDRAIEELEALLQDTAATEDRGVVDQDVDPAPVVEHLGDVALDVGLAAHVAGDRHRLAAVTLDPANARAGGVRVEVVARRLGAVARQRERHPAANVRTGAGDECDLAFEGDVHCYARPSMITLLTWV